MPRQKAVWFIAAIFVLIAAIPVIVFLKGKNPKAVDYSILEIINTDSGKIYGNWRIDKENEFSIEFIHSVNQSPVRETFRIDGSKIKTVAVRFHSFGAGMQTELEEGLTMDRDGDAFVITGFNNNFTELNYIVGTISDHLLQVNGETISLKNLCGKNAHITLRTGEIK
ncbi:MAG: DUF1850 domain-containing protein [Treponema sp.]|nr:DUF1850 domain-containing protein [Treponema sp.]